MKLFLDILKDALLDTAKLLPFLYLTYLAMEWLERRAGEKTAAFVTKSGRFAPLVGSLLGVLPQCGFSAAGAGLYAGRVITGGTLLAIFLSTSDEMLPLLLSSGAPTDRILKILGIKVAVALAAGFLFDGTVRLAARRKHREKDACREEEVHIGEICRSGHCHCEDHSPFLAALIHTGEIALTVLLVNLGLGFLLETVGSDFIAELFPQLPFLPALLSAAVGLIPNCAASVAITQLYLEGVLSAGSLLSGLLVGAGVGLLILWRTNRPFRDSLRLTAVLFAVGVTVGYLFDALRLGDVLGI